MHSAFCWFLVLLHLLNSPHKDLGQVGDLSSFKLWMSSISLWIWYFRQDFWLLNYYYAVNKGWVRNWIRIWGDSKSKNYYSFISKSKQGSLFGRFFPKFFLLCWLLCFCITFIYSMMKKIFSQTYNYFLFDLASNLPFQCPNMRFGICLYFSEKKSKHAW